MLKKKIKIDSQLLKDNLQKLQYFLFRGDDRSLLGHGNQTLSNEITADILASFIKKKY